MYQGIEFLEQTISPVVILSPAFRFFLQFAMFVILGDTETMKGKIVPAAEN